MPPNHGGRFHNQQHPTEPGPTHRLGQHGEYCPVGIVEAGSFDLTLQHHHLVTQSQDLGVASITRKSQQNHPSRDETNKPTQETDHSSTSYPPPNRPSPAQTYY